MDDLIAEEPPSFSSKIKMETLLATFQLPQHVNDQDTLSLQSFAGLTKIFQKVVWHSLLIFGMAFTFSLTTTYNNLY